MPPKDAPKNKKDSLVASPDNVSPVAISSTDQVEDDEEVVEEVKPDVPPPEPEPKVNGCEKCWKKTSDFVVHDAIYGSFFGPHPVSFICCCKPCKKCISLKCVRPFCVASIATKVMYFCMLGFITLLACFFIIPWRDTWLSHESTAINAFRPCQNGKMAKYQDTNGGCATHAGYFMVYRCFFAFGTLMLTNCFIMINVKSTTVNNFRAKIHRGFWLYKYLYLGGLLLIYFVFLDGASDPNGIFEFGCTVIGNAVNIFFSLVILAFMLDLVELWVIENKTSGNSWAPLIYGTVTGLIVLLDLVVLGAIFDNFLYKQKLEVNANGTVIHLTWPRDNCVEGQKDEIEPLHLILILSSMGVVTLLIVIMSFKGHYEARFPYTGWLQCSVVALFNFLYLWSSLYSSPRIHSRPRCNPAIKSIDIFTSHSSFNTSNQSVIEHDHRAELQDGSLDVYFRMSGFVHGILAILTLLYFTFIHGPRSDTAPLSIAYYYFISDSAKVPVFPDPDAENCPQEFQEAIEKLDVWDDEQNELAYNWSLFYVIMICGSLSLMMSMTNFTDPWSPDRYNSSWVALGCKFATAVFATFVYECFLLIPCAKINPESVSSSRRTRGTVDTTGGDEEKETEVVDPEAKPADAKPAIEITSAPAPAPAEQPRKGSTEK